MLIQNSSAIFFKVLIKLLRLKAISCGIFAISDSTRAEAGSSFCGVMEMSGNVHERTVTLGNATGRVFSGTHGNGELSGDGHADVSDWPGYSFGEVTSSIGSGFRGGGAYNDVAETMRVSNRAIVDIEVDGRAHYMGFRAVRTE